MYAPVDLDGQFDIVVDVPLEVHELVRLVVDMAMGSCFFFVCKQII